MAAQLAPVDLLSFVKETGEAIAKSKIFSCENEYQGRVIALSCYVTRRDPLSIPQEFHLMAGKLSLRSDAMLGRLQKAGGSHEIVARGPDGAAIKVTYKGQTYTESLTWDEAKLEPFVYQGKPKDLMPKLLAGKLDELTLSTNYATPRRRMQHLWARVVSDAVRAVAAELVTGSYTPEEVSDFSGLAMPKGLLEQATAGESPGFSTTAGSPSPAEATGARVVLSDGATMGIESCDDQSTIKPKLAEPDPIWKEIQILVRDMGITEPQLLAACKKRGADSYPALLPEKQVELLQALQEKAKSFKAKPAEATASEPEKGSRVDGPIPDDMRAEIVAEMKKVAQGVGGIEITNYVKEQLASKGLKLADLTFAQGRRLLSRLEAKAMQQFFDEDLAEAAKKSA